MDYSVIKKKLQEQLEVVAMVSVNAITSETLDHDGQIQRYRGCIKAGADIITTRVPIVAGSPDEFEWYEAFKKASQSGREAIDAEDTHGDRSVYLAGALEYHNKAKFDFDEGVKILKQQMKGLVDGGAHILQMGSISEARAAKMAIFALEELKEEQEEEKDEKKWAETIPLFLSCVVKPDGRMECGQNLQAFVVSTLHGRPMCIGLEQDSATPQQILKVLSDSTESYVSCKLPFQQQSFSGLVNIFIADFDPKNVENISRIAKTTEPRKPPMGVYQDKLVLSAADPLVASDTGEMRDLVTIGQRCDVPHIGAFRKIILDMANLNEKICKEIGDKETEEGHFKHKFKGLDDIIRRFRQKEHDLNQKQFEVLMHDIENMKALQNETLEMARNQVGMGAQVLNLLFDPITLPKPKENLAGVADWMEWFVKLVRSDYPLHGSSPGENVHPHAARVPLCINSTFMFEVIVHGLKSTDGKSIANAISFEKGEQVFKEQAKVLKKLGAAVIVIPIMEDGKMAKTVDDKVATCLRAYDILTTEISYNKNDIILDPMVTKTAAKHLGPEEYGWNFLEATRRIRRETEKRGGKAWMTGGISGVSQVLRPEPDFRKQLNCIFLKQAMEAGMHISIMEINDIADETQAMLMEDLVTDKDAEAKRKLKEFYYAKKTKNPWAWHAI